MSLRHPWFVFSASASLVLGLASLAAGCRADTETDNSSGNGGDSTAETTSTGNTGGGSSTSTTATGTGGGGTGGGGTGGSSTSTGTGSTSSTGGGACMGQEVTVQQITNASVPGAVGKNTPVKVKGVVATSKKFLVSQSNTTGSCLYGVFVSAPGLTEAQPYSGLLVVAYGNEAVVPPGGNKAYCGKISNKMPDDPPSGDVIPDDTKPGDVLDIGGTASEYIPSSCGTMPTDSTTPQKQLAFACSVTKTGTAPVPAPHVFTDPADVAKIGDQAASDFHTQWGGALIGVAMAKPVPQDDPAGGANKVVVGNFGQITLQDSNIIIGDKIYYRGYETNKCFKGPVFSDLNVTWTKTDGLHYLNFCTWGLQTQNKCSDFNPTSEDCTGLSCY